MISWQLKKQLIIATSNLENEYSSFSEAVKEDQWLPQILADTDWDFATSTPVSAESSSGTSPSLSSTVYLTTLSISTIIFTDSQGSIQMVKSEGVTAQNKHFNIHLFKSHEVQQEGIVDLVFILSKDNAADELMKAIGETMYHYFLKIIGMQL
ncbi:hypothetical protein L873DRAFT_433550 [Choiromyces venosus 120613-1]|uniref:Uncharacterized protein n=1 Tax=Choiromyces venosus 120613-1 TaxID=1336337 RepID=A0A3N4IWE2_9PEZI|nr:hypothetical protein L873DRAFT_433550 [Choiromyces venosus 120613-1]